MTTILAKHLHKNCLQMVPGGTAANSGKLRVGDRILKVNGEDITTYSHQDAVMALLRPADSITLTVRHDPLPEGYQVGEMEFWDVFHENMSYFLKV